MDILGGIPPRTANHDSLAFLVPLEDRSRADVEFAPHLRRDPGLPLCRYVRTSNSHGRYITTVMRQLPALVLADPPTASADMHYGARFLSTACGSRCLTVTRNSTTTIPTSTTGWT